MGLDSWDERMLEREFRDTRKTVSKLSADVSKEFKDARKTVSDISKDVSKGFSAVAESLKQLNQRLDVMEQAIADPQSDAANALRKKHGMGKNGPVRPIGQLSKKGGA